MHRSAVRTATVMSLVALLAAAALPAQAKSSRPKQHRGKKAMGEVVSFDEATMTLVVDLPGEEDFTGAVDPDVQVKVDHRGWAKKSGSHGNPTEGSLEDLVAGTAVLRMKVEDEVVTKIRIRRPAEEAPPVEDGDEGDDSPDDSEDTTDPADDADDSDDSDDSDDDEDSADDSDDEDSADDSEDPAP